MARTSAGLRCTRVRTVTAADRDGARDVPPEARRPSYEQARDELTELVKRLEAGGLTLEQSLELWERGERLAAVCTEWLEGARARLAEAMAQRAEGSDPDAPF
jgi:exodeoxyribonuclease VII small subunit